MTSLMVINARDFAVPASQQDLLKTKAESIRKRLRASVASVISVGTELREIKPSLKHGDFTSFVVNDCGITMRSAQNYMSVAEFADDKSESISLLSLGSLYRLAAKSTPTAAISQVVEMLDNGKVTTESDIEALIAASRLTEVEPTDPPILDNDLAEDLAARLLAQVGVTLAHQLIAGPWRLIGKHLRRSLSSPSSSTSLNHEPRIAADQGAVICRFRSP